MAWTAGVLDQEGVTEQRAEIGSFLLAVHLEQAGEPVGADVSEYRGVLREEVVRDTDEKDFEVVWTLSKAMALRRS